MGNEQPANTPTQHARHSTKLQPPGYLTANLQRENSASRSKSKSKSKTKNRSYSKSKSNLQLPDISTSIGNNGSIIYSTTHSSLFSGYRTKTKKHFKNIDINNIENGITGTHISPRIVKIAAEFWEEHISHKSLEDKLEFGCAIYFGMMVHNAEMKRVFARNLTSKQSIEKSSIKFLDMMGWLIRSLLCSDADVFKLLQNLGQVHAQMGVTDKHFDPMLQSMHETFSYYFPIRYGIQIKYAIDQIFTLAARIMTGQHHKHSEMHKYNHLDDLQDSINKHDFLTSLPKCLASNVGREYLFRYLQQTFCDEIAIFLESLSKFKVATSDKERFMVARSIVKNSIEPAAMFAVNVSYETRTNVMNHMVELERIFFEKDDLVVTKDLFKCVEKEIHKLIMDNHWLKFNNTFKNIDKSPNSPN